MAVSPLSEVPAIKQHDLFHMLCVYVLAEASINFAACCRAHKKRTANCKRLGRDCLANIRGSCSSASEQFPSEASHRHLRESYMRANPGPIIPYCLTLNIHALNACLCKSTLLYLINTQYWTQQQVDGKRIVTLCLGHSVLPWLL